MSRQSSLFSTDFTYSDAKTTLEKKLHLHFMTEESNEPIKNSSIYYSFQETSFGNLLIASTDIGICYAAFYDDQKDGVTKFNNYYQYYTIQAKHEAIHKEALLYFQKDQNKWPTLTLHLKGTAFQLQIWKALLKIPLGKLSSYNAIANLIDKPKASRAVGTAIGKNPIAYIIPCHRVVQTNGQLGGYMWGMERKAAILNWELNK